jgi:DNA-binding NarL/FixJ family response regulator
MRKRRAGWSSEEDETLARLVAEGASKVQIALKLKRTQSSIAMRAKKLGLTLKRRKRFRFDPLVH